ncbi:hypothetical protein KEM52_000014 [Ascosphaera acerosa]|nr:hypothetical protein KEM52_000014 [Ascosphaera acerosa]
MTQEQKDALPNDAGPLDGLLNYHLGQLGRLKQEVATYNATIEQLDYTYRDMIGYPTATHTAQMLWARIQAERAARDSLFSFAMFHVEEIERIVRHKACLAGAPELVTNM